MTGKTMTEREQKKNWNTLSTWGKHAVGVFERLERARRRSSELEMELADVMLLMTESDKAEYVRRTESIRATQEGKLEDYTVRWQNRRDKAGVKRVT